MKPVKIFHKGLGLLLVSLMSNLLIGPALSYGKETMVKQHKKIVIAHRGASGYLPEHTLAAKAMAYAMGADYLEQDLVMTRDKKIIVLHDHHLDAVTNVKDIFPDRHRKDGRYYVIDFTLAEIQTLSVSERFHWKDGKKIAVFLNRFPLGKSDFKIHTFEDEIELVQGLNISTGRNVGIYPEIKSPAFHKSEGQDISRAVLKVLKAYGYSRKSDRVYLQCFDPVELKHIHDDLLPEMGMELKLVQLLEYTQEYIPFLSQKGMKDLAKFADGIGPDKDMLVLTQSSPDALQITPLVKAAHDAGLEIHPYTFRREKEIIPAYAKSYEDLLDIFFFQVGVDGVFTDFTDLTVNFLKEKNKDAPTK